MTYDYNKEEKIPMEIALENGITIMGIFLDERITPASIPKGKVWYQIRHEDDDWGEPYSLKRGCVAVNFMGTFIADPIKGLENAGDELDIIDYNIME